MSNLNEIRRIAGLPLVEGKMPVPDKFVLTFKDSSAFDESFEDAYRDYPEEDFDDAEFEKIQSKVRKVSKKWVKYGEMISIEIDLNTGTAVLLPATAPKSSKKK